MDDPLGGDAVLGELVFAALDHGTGSVENAEAGPLIPFVMTRGPDGPKLVRFVGTDYGQDRERALAHGRTGDHGHWAVAWDGFLTLQGTRTDAIFVQAAAVGSPEVLFAWRYDRGPEGTLRRIGNPAFLGNP